MTTRVPRLASPPVSARGTGGSLQRRPAPADARPSGESAPPIVHEVLRSPGRGLEASTRAFMEPRFGHDFSQVRVHTDDRAAASARAVDALAYTVGKDIVFARDQFTPDSRRGQQLLAHELAHVVQQAQTPGGARDLRIGPAHGGAEHAADRVAGAALGGRPAPVSPAVTPSVQRQAAPPTPPAKEPDPGQDLPQPRFSVQVPFGFATFQVPIGGSKGTSNIFRLPSSSNSPLDSIYQPNLALVLNYSFHKGATGFELSFSPAQGAGLFGKAGANGQYQTYLQPTWVFASKGPHQGSAFLQPSFSLAWGNNAVAGKTTGVLGGIQYSYTMKETEHSQWLLTAQVTGGYNHTNLDDPSPGTPGSQDGGVIGFSIGFQFNGVVKRYPKPPADPPAAAPPQPQPEPPRQQQPPPPAPPQPAPAPPVPATPPTPGSQEIFFRLDLPHPGQGGSDLTVLSAEGRANLAVLASTLRDNPSLKVQFIGTASEEGSREYNYALGGRRAEWLAAQLGIAADRLANPPANDLSSDCRPLRAGVFSCGATGANPRPDPHDRRVLVRFFP